MRTSMQATCPNATSTNTYYTNIEDEGGYRRGKRWKSSEMKAIS